MSNSRRWRELVTWIYNYNAVRGYIPYDEIIAVIDSIKRNEKPRPSLDNRVECIQCGGTGFEDMGDIQIGCINCNGTGKVARREE